MTETIKPTISPAWFREVLSAYPTGVCVVMGESEGEVPEAMIVGTFISISLNPPLVGFLPMKTSTTWARIAKSGKFSVNFLAAHQDDLCQMIAEKHPSVLRQVGWRTTTSGTPILRPAMGWIDCEISQVHEAGDHLIVVGAVLEMDLESKSPPLTFVHGTYGAVSALTPPLNNGAESLNGYWW